MPVIMMTENCNPAERTIRDMIVVFETSLLGFAKVNMSSEQLRELQWVLNFDRRVPSSLINALRKPILRSAAAFGASGVVMTRRHSPPLNGTLAKAASGALEWVPIAMVQNLANALADLKAQGTVLLGLDSEAPAHLEDEPFTGPVAIVMGAEGKGLRQLTAETCTRLVSVSTAGTLASLNVSNAAAIALHVALMKRKAR